MSDDLVIRAASRDDASDIARLLAQHGMLANATTLIGRLGRLETTGLDQVLLADLNNAVVGLLVLHLIPALLHDDGPLASITAFAGATTPNVGEALLESAEKLAQQAGCGRIELSSDNVSASADALYAARGYRVAHARVYKSLR